MQPSIPLHHYCRIGDFPKCCFSGTKINPSTPLAITSELDMPGRPVQSLWMSAQLFWKSVYNSQTCCTFTMPSTYTSINWKRIPMEGGEGGKGFVHKTRESHYEILRETNFPMSLTLHTNLSHNQHLTS